MSNSNEFLTGTAPTNALSALRIISATASGNDVAITWRTAGGRTNVVQATAGGVDGDYTNDFTDLTGLFVISGSGDATTNHVDTNGATNSPARYYRIRLAP
jgi:nucleoside diphosphate kinase